MSSLKLVYFNSSPIFLPLITQLLTVLLAMALCKHLKKIGVA